MATEYPQSTISGLALSTFGRLVAERTSGVVTTRSFYGNELGITSAGLVAASGSVVEGGDAFAGPMEAIDAVFGLPSLPFVVQSIASAKSVNARARNLYAAALRARGHRLLFVTIWPATGVWSDKPITSADDLKALSIRTYDYNSAAVMRGMGAKAEYMPFNDVFDRLKNRQLNAILTSGDGGAGRKLWDYLKYFTAINYAIPISITFVRQSAFDALPGEVRAQVEQAAAEAEQAQLDLLTTRTAENRRRMTENGVTITDPPPGALMAALKQSAAATIAGWTTRTTAEAVAILEWANGH